MAWYRSFTKSLLIRFLKRDNQLHLFRRLEQCSKKQINCDGSVEFLRLCEDFDLTPTFAKVDQDKCRKWKESSETFSENVLTEELCQKRRLSLLLKSEINSIYDEIRQTCSFFCYTCILRTITELHKKYYHEVLDIHTRKISRLVSRQDIINISSYKLSFFQKLVLCHGLKFAIPKHVSSIDVRASFAKAYWKLEPRLLEEFRDLVASTLRSVALNYIH